MSAQTPVVACYCATFLAPEMLHIHRQLLALQKFQPLILTQKRLHGEKFPFPKEWIEILRRPSALQREWRRFWWKKVRRAPWPISGREQEQIQALLYARGAQVLHVYFGHIATHLRPLLTRRLLPSVVSFHGADAGVDLNRPAHGKALRAVFQAVDLVLARSNALMDDLIEAGCDPEKLRLHRTGIPLEAWEFQQRSAPRDGAWKWLQAGRLIEKKGLDLTLGAFAAALHQYPTASLTIAGEGPLRETLEAQAAELGISHAVKFTGFVEEPELIRLCHESHLFLHPSRTGKDGNREGVPNAMLEAMATGLPAVATRHGGIPEAVEDGKGGLLVGENDQDSLAHAALDLMGDDGHYEAMGREASRAVREKFEQAAQARILEGYYEEAIELWSTFKRP